LSEYPAMNARCLTQSLTSSYQAGMFTRAGNAVHLMTP
jgi:hypothetical protein